MFGFEKLQMLEKIKIEQLEYQSVLLYAVKKLWEYNKKSQIA